MQIFFYMLYILKHSILIEKEKQTHLIAFMTLGSESTVFKLLI